MTEIKYITCSNCKKEFVNLYRDNLCYDCWWANYYENKKKELEELAKQNSKKVSSEIYKGKDFSEAEKEV